MVLSTALFDKPAFQNLICNGLVLGEDGKKLSKRLKNYSPPTEIIDEYGAVSQHSTESFLLFSLKRGHLPLDVPVIWTIRSPEYVSQYGISASIPTQPQRKMKATSGQSYRSY